MLHPQPFVPNAQRTTKQEQFGNSPFSSQQIVDAPKDVVLHSATGVPPGLSMHVHAPSEYVAQTTSGSWALSLSHADAAAITARA